MTAIITCMVRATFASFFSLVTMANALSCAMYYLALNLIRVHADSRADYSDGFCQFNCYSCGLGHPTKGTGGGIISARDGSDDILPIVEQSKNLTYINRVILEVKLLAIHTSKSNKRLKNYMLDLRVNPPAEVVIHRKTAEGTDLMASLSPRGR